MVSLCQSAEARVEQLQAAAEGDSSALMRRIRELEIQLASASSSPGSSTNNSARGVVLGMIVGVVASATVMRNA